MKTNQIEESFEHLLRNLGSDKSRRGYRIDWERYCTWLSLRADGVGVVEAKPRHIEEHLFYLQDTKCTRSTCSRALSVIRAVYSMLVRDEVLSSNPAREVKTQKFDSMPNTPFLKEEQVRQLINQPTQSWRERRDLLCVSLLLGLGWRRSEVAVMRIEDFDGATVTGIVKGGKRLTVGVPPWLRERITEWVGERTQGPLLPREADNQESISDDIVYNIVTEWSAKIGIKISPHGLRRTLITLARERGVDLKTMQLAVGHASQSTTERYDKGRDASKNAPGQVFASLLENSDE